MEIGPRDIQNQQFIAIARDNRSKETIAMATAVDRIKQLLDDVQKRLFEK